MKGIMVLRSHFSALALLSLCGVAQAVVIAFDDASDAAYNTGWANGSNGGYGFGAWSHSANGTHSMGDSNTNGTLGGPGINVGGRAWRAEHNPGWQGSVAGRSINSFNIGDALEVDVDFGLSPGSGQGVAVIGAADVCQVQAVSSSSTLLINNFAGSITTTMPYSDGGFRVRFEWVSSASMDVTLTSFASSLSQTYTVAYAPGAGSHFVTFQTENPVAGQALYASRMAVYSPVPEPFSLAGIAVGFAGLLRRRTRVERGKSS